MESIRIENRPQGPVLVIETPIKEPRISSTGKTLVVGFASGFTDETITHNGQRFNVRGQVTATINPKRGIAA